MKLLINEFFFQMSSFVALVLLVLLYILKFKKKHDFARLIFSQLRNFKKWGNSYFPISKEPLDQNSTLPPLWNNN